MFEIHDVDLKFYDAVPEQIKAELEQRITMQELHKALSNLKNTSCPGGDGFSAKFYKHFWPNLNFLIYKSVIFCSNKPKPTLSPLQRMGIITLIPKGEKDRSLINNWRPISLLSVIYKLLSGAIANRFKKALPHIISQAQKAYLPNRFIGCVTKSVYDLQYYAKKRKLKH